MAMLEFGEMYGWVLEPGEVMQRQSSTGEEEGVGSD